MILKNDCEQKLNQQNSIAVQQKIESDSAKASVAIETVEKSVKPKRVRPDQDPTTRVGRAAIDIQERKLKTKKV